MNRKCHHIVSCVIKTEVLLVLVIVINFLTKGHNSHFYEYFFFVANCNWTVEQRNVTMMERISSLLKNHVNQKQPKQEKYMLNVDRW